MITRNNTLKFHINQNIRTDSITRKSDATPKRNAKAHEPRTIRGVLPRVEEDFPAEKAKGLESTMSSSSSTSDSSLNSWKSASKSSSKPKISDLRGRPAQNRFPELDFFRSGQRRSAVTRWDRAAGMKSEIIAPPHIILCQRGLAVEKVERFQRKKQDSVLCFGSEAREREAFTIFFLLNKIEGFIAVLYIL